jgi:hypothetical protein
MDSCQVVAFLHFVCTYSIIISVPSLELYNGFFQCLTGISGFIKQAHIYIFYTLA